MEEEIIDIDGDHDGDHDIIDIETPVAQEDQYNSNEPLTAATDLQDTQETTSPVSVNTRGPKQSSSDRPFKPPMTTAAAAALAASTMTTRRSNRSTMTPPAYPETTTERATRSSTMQRPPRFQPKLKLKVSERQAAGISFLGPYDRELDSDDEDLAFEEQFVLRMPPGEDCERLRAMVDKREISKDVWFKFKDSRRGVFHIGDSLYSSKLVDLPCVVESQKTLDNKNMFKVADICQMLVVEDKIKNQDDVLANKSFNIDEFIWPHGLTPPLHWVRKRRFRKRVNRRTIETVEQEVERLLAEDAKSSRVTYDVLDNVNPDLSDSEFVDPEEPSMEADADMDGEFGRTSFPMDDEEEEDEEEDEEEEGDIDEELAAELAREMGEEGDEEGSQSDVSDETSEAGDDDDEDEEVVQAKKLLQEEIRDLEAAVARKESEISASVNPLVKKRFEDQLKKMRADLEQKQAQREQLMEEQRLQRMGKEGGPSPSIVDTADAEVDQEIEEDDDADMEEVTETPG